MKGTKFSRLLGIALALAGTSAASAAIVIDTVHVGDAGNAADTNGTIGCGSVAYEYNIGKYEVTAGQYTAFLNAVAATDTYGLYNTSMWSNTQGCKIQRSGASGSYTYSVAADYADRPVTYVSYGDAMRFANWLQNGQLTGSQNLTTTEDGAYYLDGATSNAALQAVSRESDWTWAIPSEDEWYKAAFYKGGSTNAGYWLYPTQNNTTPGRDMDDVSGNNANTYGNTFPIQSPYYTTEVGEFQNSESAYGTFDQGGNVYEWDEAYIYDSKRRLRGGSFYYPDDMKSENYHSYNVPTYEDHQIGFRVVQVPEPGTLALLFFGAAGLMIRRRRAS